MTESSSELKVEIGHVLFIDIVGYSKLLIDEQSEQLQKLKEIVWGTEQFRQAQAEGKLLRLPTGDGGALVFRNNPEAPVRCAMEISKELKRHPELHVRMGIHSGPVNEVTDLNAQANIAGAGINTARRVMDCADAGHILLSRHVAEDLEQYPHWRSYLHNLGECEVKHGARLGVVNLAGDGVGNAATPKKFETIKKRRAQMRWAAVAVAVLVLGAIAGGTFFFSRYPTHSAMAIVNKSIAVLPFENRSSDKENAYFTDGVQDEILTDLAKIADLKVISRTSVMQYKSGLARNLRRIGEELGVAHVVEGSVQRVANKIRVNAQLIDARTDAHLWAQTYDRDLADVFAIQSEIAKAIAEQLQAKLSPNEKKAIEQPPTNDLAAFDLYTRAKSLIRKAGLNTTATEQLLKAIELLDDAVKRDPSFFDAHRELAWAHATFYAISDHTPARLALAEAALQAVERLRPDAAETNLARANFLYYVRRDYGGALAELEKARPGLPNDPRLFELTGYCLRRRGQFQEGLSQLQRAAELDPRNVTILSAIAISYEMLGRYADALAGMDRALDIEPDAITLRANRGLYSLCWKADTRPLHQTIDAVLAQKTEAITDIADLWFNCALAERDLAAAERALVALGADHLCWTEGGIYLSHSFGEGLLARLNKDEARARAAFEAARTQQEKVVQEQPDAGGALSVLGMIDAALGHKELALEEGRRAIALMPINKDVTRGCRVVQYFAITAAWAGDKDLALQQLEAGVRAPSKSLMLSYGFLKLHPFWDPFRGDPRFEQIVQSLAPKEPPK